MAMMKCLICVSTVCIIFFALIIGCSNPFSPKPKRPPDIPVEVDIVDVIPDATTPEIFLENLDFAMDHKDIGVYEDLLDERYWWTEPNQTDSLDFAWGKDRDIEVVKRIFEEFAIFDFDFTQAVGTRGRFTEEKGTELPQFEGDPNAHTDEDWEVLFGPVNMFMVDETRENGFRVSQNMTFKLRQNEKGLWKIVRWIDDPILQ